MHLMHRVEGVRRHYWDGGKDFFTYRADEDIARRTVEEIVNLKIRHAEFRMSDGSLVIVRRR